MSKDGNRVSICSFCSRMKRGVLYATARREGYNVLAMAQVPYRYVPLHASTLCHTVTYRYTRVRQRARHGAGVMPLHTVTHEGDNVLARHCAIDVSYRYISQAVYRPHVTRRHQIPFYAVKRRTSRHPPSHTAHATTSRSLSSSPRQHLDDLAESFMMSALHNGALRSMKAHYTIDAQVRRGM